MSTIRAIVDDIFARAAPVDAAPAEDTPSAPPRAAPFSSPEAEAARGVRAQKMFDAAGIQKGDIAPRVRDLVHCMLQALCEATDRIAALERVPFQYTGAHVPGQVYRRGQFATLDGSVWHANETTSQRPGDGPAWTLAVKRGKDLR